MKLFWLKLVKVSPKSESFYEMDAVVSGAIRRGQHLYYIMQTNDLGVSKSTIYRHLNRGN
jgi:transposase, IS30 family